MGRARDIANVLSSSTNIALDSELGLSLITPTSVATTGGSATISSSGGVSFTSASAVSLNGIFSSTYKNYLIQLSLTGATADSVVFMKLRNSGTDASTNYYWAFVGFSTSSADTNTAGSPSTSGILLCSTEADLNKAYYSANVNIFRPFEAVVTAYSALLTGSTSAAAPMTRSGGGWHTTESSYDGINLIPSAGNITGDITVYGYRK